MYVKYVDSQGINFASSFLRLIIAQKHAITHMTI